MYLRISTTLSNYVHQLDHPNIVRLEEVYENESEIYLVQELCLGGELFDRLDEQPDYHYTEAQCARLVKQMLCAVRYLHSKGIIHRDLKVRGDFDMYSLMPHVQLTLNVLDVFMSTHANVVFTSTVFVIHSMLA